MNNTKTILSILCLVMVPLSMAPKPMPEKIKVGPIKPQGFRNTVIEERDGSDALIRQIVYGGGAALWQIHAVDGSSQYLHENPRDDTVMLTEGAGSPTAAAGEVLERMVPTPYGVPYFQDANNQNKTDGGGNFLAKSDFGNTLLYMGRWYDPETGSRARGLNADRGGLYDFGGRFLNPDEGRFITRFAEGDPDRPIITGRYAFAGHAPVSRMKGDFSRGHLTDRRGSTSGYNQTDLDFVVSRADRHQIREHILLGRQVGPASIPAHAREWTDYNASDPGRAMKESGEKGGTEDINIGVGELHGSSGGGHEIAHDLGLPPPVLAVIESGKLLEKMKTGNESATDEHGEFWFDNVVSDPTAQAYPAIELEKARISSYSHSSASDDSGLFWFTGLSPGSGRARHRGFFIIDRSIPTSGQDGGSSCWIRDSQPWPGRVVVKGKNILEN